MKKFFTFFLLLTCAASANLKAQYLWREGFNDANSTITGTNPNAGPSVSSWGAGVESAPFGTWYLHNAYRTTGSGCVSGASGANQHLRTIQGANLAPSNAADSPYFATPIIAPGYGVKEIHFARSGTIRRYSIYVSTDTVATVAPYSSPSWTLVQGVPSTHNECTSGVDTFVTVPSGIAANVKRVAFVVSQAANADIDSIGIIPVNPLPVKFSSVNANYTSGVVKINWTNETEINTSSYEVERSTDGKTFTSVGSVAATNVRGYSFIDNSSLSGTSYYRIKAVDANGALTYSNVVKVSADSKAAEMVVSPNPVTGGTLGLRLNNFAAGQYTLNIFNTGSQKVFSGSVSHAGGSSIQTIILPASVKKGLYTVSLTNGASKFVKTIVVE
ncbi:T9SS type A sorting domain-containing protein [Ferruginibacter albus]|uniref:T9SS type A sorting domain-containing protein n=1 Tax=Ferruginibacter albus TaxID=2875540 RepID=UPI001CC60019|nr:T9SS type A sorting domain-containing protein [Ferruginibacter albus]UAY53654.1 T9SS type A sorting domain-containing protein [Ferruginibacter albus]